MTSPHLSRLDEVISEYTAETRTHGETVAWLRAHGFTVDEIALDAAVTALRDRDRLLDGTLAPCDFLECLPNPLVDLQAYAVAAAESDYDWALHELLPRSQARAS